MENCEECKLKTTCLICKIEELKFNKKLEFPYNIFGNNIFDPCYDAYEEYMYDSNSLFLNK